MSTSTYTGAVPLRVLARGEEGRVNTPRADREPSWFVPRGEEMTLQFLSHYDDSSDTGWYSFREAQASGILLPGSWSEGPYAGTPRGELPYGMREIPLEDVEMLPDGEKYKPRRQYLEVTPGNLMNVKDDIIDARSQRFNDDNGRTKAEFVAMANVIAWAWPATTKKDGSKASAPEVGAHILLKMTKNQALMIIERLAEKAEDDDIDILQYKWKVTIVGGKPNKLILKRGEKITEPLEYELFDIATIVAARKERWETHVKAAFADYMGLNVKAPEVTEAAETEAEPDTVGDAEQTDLYDLISTSAIRARLKKKGVLIPAGSSREKLIELAVEAEA